jgi:putative cardiolipin synthase
MDLAGRDDSLSTFAAHPNISLRIFNPFDRQTMRAIQFMTRFGSVTRRMHNKSFTVDNQATIVGGRNIGDEYFDADPLLAFADLDILAIGPVVSEVSASFDEYWNSSLAYPITVLRPDLVEQNNLTAKRKELAEYLTQDSVTEYIEALKTSALVHAIKNHEVTYTWGKARVYSDHPDKLKSYEEDKSLDLSHELKRFFKELHQELLIFSPYFVPGKEGTKTLVKLSKRGVRVRILTNSLSSTDVGVVHAGYAKYRRELLRAGVELYEMNKSLSKTQRKQRNREEKGLGSSKASLHAKSFVFDREHVFIGSLNLDPRSVTENTEIGIMVTSKKIVDDMATAFDLITETMAFRLKLNTDEDGMELISWHGQKNDEKRVWSVEPNTGFWQRLSIFFISLLPIESQL